MKMKKTIIISAILLSASVVHAQGFDPSQDREFAYDFMHITNSTIVIIVFMIFIIVALRLIFDNRIKNKMIEKGVPENVVEQLLQPTKKDSKAMAMKWFLILAAIGIGLAVVKYTLPLGVHSAAIMFISISLSFLGYFYFIKQSEK